MSSSLVRSVVAFCRALRARDVPVTAAESLDAVRAVVAVDVSDREDVRAALRAVLATSHQDLAIFDELFDAFWHTRSGAEAIPGLSHVRSTRPPNADSQQSRISLENWMRKGASSDDVVQVRQASTLEASAQRNLVNLAAGDQQDIERLARRIARRMALKRSRRWRVRARGRRIDLRRTMRALLRTGGDFATLARRDRIVRRTRLVVLCDVSGSMELYARLLLRFVHALQNAFARVETFVFSTRLTRVTHLFHRASYLQALSAMGEQVRDYSGGTRIGEALIAFADGWPELLNSRTVVLVLSDGWDTGDPRMVDASLQRIARRAGRVVWLNPLMGSPDFSPETRAMRAALPHVDVLASAHNVVSLQALARHLVL